MQRLVFDMKHVFIDPSVGQYTDLRRILQGFPAEVIVADPGMLGALFVQEKTQTPTLIVGVLPVVISSVDTAPFGFGIQPSSSRLGRIRNRALNLVVQRAVLGSVQKHWNDTRAQIGLPPTGWWMDTVTRATVYLQLTIPGFEYPRSDLRKNVRFIGMMPPERPLDVALPEFWHELETFLSYPDLLPRTAAMVTNGGYGGVQMALSYGVPLAVAGRTEAKPEVAARVAWSGAGIDLKTNKPSPAAVRNAIRRLLRDPRYKANACALSAEHARHDSLALALDAIHAAIGVPR